jgi:NIMA (never in mitosis gene a)-related kinase 1/4/5
VFLKEGQIKIGDFGLSKSTAGINVAFTQCGTPLYSSPELIKNNPYSFKSDIW